MKIKFKNKVIGLVTLLLLPLVMQTIHVVHITNQANTDIQCHHHHDDDDHTTKHDHEKCHICDFEFGLFSDELTFFKTEPYLIYFSIVSIEIPVFPNNEVFNLQQLRGPPVSVLA